MNSDYVPIIPRIQENENRLFAQQHMHSFDKPNIGEMDISGGEGAESSAIYSFISKYYIIVIAIVAVLVVCVIVVLWLKNRRRERREEAESKLIAASHLGPPQMMPMNNPQQFIPPQFAPPPQPAAPQSTLEERKRAMEEYENTLAQLEALKQMKKSIKKSGGDSDDSASDSDSDSDSDDSASDSGSDDNESDDSASDSSDKDESNVDGGVDGIIDTSDIQLQQSSMDMSNIASAVIIGISVGDDIATTMRGMQVERMFADDEDDDASAGNVVQCEDLTKDGKGPRCTKAAKPGHSVCETHLRARMRKGITQ